MCEETVFRSLCVPGSVVQTAVFTGSVVFSVGAGADLTKTGNV